MYSTLVAKRFHTFFKPYYIIMPPLKLNKLIRLRYWRIRATEVKDKNKVEKERQEDAEDAKKSVLFEPLRLNLCGHVKNLIFSKAFIILANQLLSYYSRNL